MQFPAIIIIVSCYPDQFDIKLIPENYFANFNIAMRYTFILLSLIILCGLGCVKKSANVNCYECTQEDSVTSNIPALDSIHSYTGVTCQLTKAQAQFFELQNTYKDTLYLKNDTERFDYRIMNCDVDY